MGGVADLDFVADMMLAGHLVNAAFGLGVGDEHAGLGEGGRGPEIQERAAAAIGDPKAGILAVPAAVGLRIGGVVVVVRVFARAVGLGRAVAAEEADIVHHRAGARLPQGGDRARVGAAGVEAEADEDIAPAFGRFDQGFGRAYALIAGRAIGQNDLRRPGVETDQDVSGRSVSVSRTT